MADWPIFVLGVFVTAIVAVTILSIGKMEERHSTARTREPASPLSTPPKNEA
jgi:hypothetical protein